MRLLSIKWDKSTYKTQALSSLWWENTRKEESWEESYTLIQIAEENIHAQIIIYSCLASHDKRQEAQQLKGGEEISSFREDQIVWNQTWFIFRGGNVKMFERGTIPQSDDSFLRHKVLLRSRTTERFFLVKVKEGFSLASHRINIFCLCNSILNTQIHWPGDSGIFLISERHWKTTLHQPQFSCWSLLDELRRRKNNQWSKSVPVWMWFIFQTAYSQIIIYGALAVEHEPIDGNVGQFNRCLAFFYFN